MKVTITSAADLRPGDVWQGFPIEYVDLDDRREMVRWLRTWVSRAEVDTMIANGANVVDRKTEPMVFERTVMQGTGLGPRYIGVDELTTDWPVGTRVRIEITPLEDEK